MAILSASSALLKILIIEFNSQNIIKIKDALSKPSQGISYNISWLQKEENILKKVEDEGFDAILLSYDLPWANGIEILGDLQYKDLNPIKINRELGSHNNKQCQYCDSQCKGFNNSRGPDIIQ